MKTNRIFSLILICLSIGQLSAFTQVITLESYIEQGLIHSPVLKDLNNQMYSNSVDSLLIKAGQRPQVSFNGSLYYAPVIGGIGYSEALTDISHISSVVYASQQIFNQKTIDARYSQIGIQNQALRVSSKITEKDLKKAITLQYLSACSISNEIAFNRDLLSSSVDEELILRQLVEKGLYKQVDYLSFMVELKGQELMLNDLQLQYQKELSALHVLCGLPGKADEQLVLPDIRLNSPISAANSPFFSRFVLDSLKIENEKVLIDRNYKPAISWFSDAGLLNNFPRDIGKNFGISMGLSLSVPIYDGHQRSLNHEKLKIAEDTRKNYAGYFQRQFSQQLQQLYLELQKTQEIIPRVNQQAGFAEPVVNQEKNLVNAGIVSMTDYVAALRNYITVKRSVNQYQLRILQIITEINYWNQ
ncbi:MAG: TolC family protein [Porphyromonadaceae bacterium]|nr:MAG: TolC family protein [Porphyromonadaceae bacterium]